VIAWALEHWYVIMTGFGAVTMRWGRTIFRALAAPITNGILRERLSERDTQVTELTALVARLRAEIALGQHSAGSSSASPDSRPTKTPTPSPGNTNEPANPSSG